ncbi:MAG: glycosyltransferase family 4 protein [Alphaproteobacteria bacterium]|nr:glycosyltransferase family 4 protein [Alphaproteobacteria bacterium]
MATGNIVFIGHPPFIEGGSGPLADQSLTNLRSAGHRVRAICAMFPGKAKWRDAFARLYPEVPVVWYDMPPLGDPFAAAPVDVVETQLRGVRPALTAMVAEDKADLVYLNRESLTWGTPTVARALGLRVLASMHGTSLASSGGTFNGHDGRARLARFGRVDLVACCAEHLTRTVREAGLSNAETLLNGVDTKLFRPRQRPPDMADRLGVTATDIVVLHASNLRSIKRPLDLVRGFARAFGGDRRLFLVIAGDGDLRDKIEIEASRLGVRDRVAMIGWIPHDDMHDCYALADFSVQTSTSEGLSMACLESMASGRPVIATDIPGSRELITDGEDGLLFPTGDIEALAGAILEMAQPKRRRPMADAGRHKVELHFSAEILARRQLEIVDQLL